MMISDDYDDGVDIHDDDIDDGTDVGVYDNNNDDNVNVEVDAYAVDADNFMVMTDD